MKPRFDFSKARRGPLVPKDPNKTLVSFRLDNYALEYLAEMVDRGGGGSLENVINTVLSDLIAVCERFPVAQREYFFARTARANLPGALEFLSKAGINKPADDNTTRARTKKSTPKKAVRVSAK